MYKIPGKFQIRTVNRKILIGNRNKRNYNQENTNSYQYRRKPYKFWLGFRLSSLFAAFPVTLQGSNESNYWEKLRLFVTLAALPVTLPTIGVFIPPMAFSLIPRYGKTISNFCFIISTVMFLDAGMVTYFDAKVPVVHDLSNILWKSSEATLYNTYNFLQQRVSQTKTTLDDVLLVSVSAPTILVNGFNQGIYESFYGQ